jgi:hypothetical protein
LARRARHPKNKEPRTKNKESMPVLSFVSLFFLQALSMLKEELPMTQPTQQQPYIQVNPGDLITAEDLNEIQQHIRADLAANGAADAKNVAELKDLIANVDAPKFGGKTPDDWTDDLDKRYIRRDDPQAAGQYRRYFKQL